ncbi:N-acetylmuramoyl-L-alanine amidase family protein [Paenibacillus cymbidii]|uniref:N-acetylmuramoyl-L-alanine amidase family protein n=1 Tax=Paenibacillus cymbidii TaxID=1639034 RepID=UPI001080BBA8|nr:N-acetylmuramoyl-L-alanine amidase [Paenibacillus cymbidii]
MKRHQQRPLAISMGTLVLPLLFLLLTSTATIQKQHNSLAERRENASVQPSPLPTAEPSPTVPPKQARIVVIDAGHGNADPGAAGASGKEEKEYTLAVAQAVYAELKADSRFELHLTRGDDSYVELLSRAALAEELHASALVSIHGNTFTSRSVSGTETYFYDDNSSELAGLIHSRLLEAMHFRDRGVRRNDWKILTHSSMPAVLTEIGYLTNPQEEAAMLAEDGIRRAAQAIAAALTEFFFPAA